MAGVSTSIELFDNMSNKLNNIINRVNSTVSSFDNLSRVMNSDVDVSSVTNGMDNISDKTSKIDKVTNSINNMNQSMSQSESSNNMADKIEQMTAQEERMARLTKIVDELEIKMNQNTNSNSIETGIDNITDKTANIENVTNNIDKLQSTISSTSGTASGDIDKVTNSIDDMNQSSGTMSNIAASSSKAFDTNELNVYNQELEWAERNLEIIGQKYVMAYNAARQAAQAFEKSAATVGTGAEATQKLKTEMLNAQAAELKLEQAVEKAGKAFEKAEVASGKVSPNIDKATGKQNKFNRFVDKSADKIDNLIKKVKSLTKAYLGIRGIKKGLEATMGEGANLQRQKATMGAAFGNMDVGKGYFSNLKHFADKTGDSVDELMNVTNGFMQYTKNTNSLKGLTDITSKMAIKTGSLSSSQNAIQEAMAGRVGQLQRSLHLTKKDVEPIEKAVEKGNVDGVIQALNSGLNTAGLTDEVVKAYRGSALQQFNSIISTTKTKLAEIGENSLSKVEPVLERINNWLQSDSSQQFFNAINVGLNGIVSLGVGVVNIISAIGQYMQDNWSVIQPILFAITGYFLVLLIKQLILVGTQLLGMAAKWFAVHWPILIVIGLIFSFIMALQSLGVTSEQILGYIGGTFGALFGFIYNGVASIWNAFACFGEFFANFFIDPIYAVKKLFYDMTIGILGFIKRMAQGLTDLVNMIPGVKVNLTSGITNIMDGIKAPTSDKNVVRFGRMEHKDYSTFATNGYNMGASIPEKINSIQKPQMPDMAAWNTVQGPGQLSALDDGSKKHLKNIDDKIDISNEQLELMRDLAEQESIQNFVTLTPTVEVTTGDIKEEADMDKIIAKIENYMENELVNSAEGMYA